MPDAALLGAVEEAIRAQKLVAIRELRPSDMQDRRTGNAGERFLASGAAIRGHGFSLSFVFGRSPPRAGMATTLPSALARPISSATCSLTLTKASTRRCHGSSRL